MTYTVYIGREHGSDRVSLSVFGGRKEGFALVPSNRTDLIQSALSSYKGINKIKLAHDVPKSLRNLDLGRHLNIVA